MNCTDNGHIYGSENKCVFCSRRKDTPATSGSADQAVKSLTGFAEALETWCAKGDINIPDRPTMARELRIVIQKAEQAAELQKRNDELHVDLRNAANNILSLRQRVAEMEE